MEVIFANHVSDKELISRIYKELLQFNNNQNKQATSKMVKGLEEDIQRRYTNGQ